VLDVVVTLLVVEGVCQPSLGIVNESGALAVFTMIIHRWTNASIDLCRLDPSTARTLPLHNLQ
jgi:hypothetical protein